MTRIKGIYADKNKEISVNPYELYQNLRIYLPESCYEAKLLGLWNDSGLKFSFLEGFFLNCVSPMYNPCSIGLRSTQVRSV